MIEVTDDGRGGALRTPGSGLEGLAQRVEALDGTLVIDSPQGGPTMIRAELPCAS
jgi:signal transduction histidine kinase